MPTISNNKSGNAAVSNTGPAIASAINPQLVAAFVQRHSAPGIALNILNPHSVAAAFLEKESEVYQRCKETVCELNAAQKNLRHLQPQLLEAHVGVSARVSTPELERSLTAVSERMEPIRRLCGLAAPAKLSAEGLCGEADKLAQALREKASSAQGTLDSLGVLLVDAARISLRTSDEQRFISELGQYLKKTSQYYPRGLSPEASAIELGLLPLGGRDCSAKNTAIHYAQAERTIDHSAKTPMPEWLQDAPALPPAGFFELLPSLKRELANAFYQNASAAPAVRKLLAVYQASGSPALAYFATLDCIAAGDQSHEMLFQAAHHAAEAGVLLHFRNYVDAQLASTPGHAPLQLQSFLAAKKLQDNVSADEALRKLPEGGIERALAFAIQDYLSINTPASIRIDTLRRCVATAHSVYSDAKNAGADARRLSQEAMEHLLMSLRELGQLGQLGQREHTMIARCCNVQLNLAPESQIGWEMALAIPFQSNAKTADTWAQVDRLLSEKPSVRGYVLAGQQALELSALARQGKDAGEAESLLLRAKRYFTEACAREGSGLGVDGLLAMASLKEARGETAESLTLLVKGLSRAPHDPRFHSVQPNSGPDTSRGYEETLSDDHPALRPELWPAGVRASIVEALRMQSGTLLESLKRNCQEFDALAASLADGSSLCDKQHAALKRIKQFVATLDTVLQKPSISTSDWNAATFGLYDVLQTRGIKEGLGPYCIDLLQSRQCAEQIDPQGDYLQLSDAVETLEKQAADAQKEFMTFFDAIRQNVKSINVRQAIVKVKSDLENIQSVIVQKVFRVLLDSRQSLSRWAESASKLNADEVSAIPSSDGGKSLPDRKDEYEAVGRVLPEAVESELQL